MTSHETARPRHRAAWADVRFVVGIVLIAASIAGVWFVVSAARQTVPVVAAARTLVPGEVIAATDVRIVDVALGTLGEAYLAPGELRDGAVATRTVSEGELVPSDAVGAGDESATTVVVMRSSVDVPESVDAGTVVEVWAAPVLEDGGHDAPRILVPDATVVSVIRDDGVVGGGAAALELVIPRAEVAAALTAMSDDSVLSVVPAVGASR